MYFFRKTQPTVNNVQISVSIGVSAEEIAIEWSKMDHWQQAQLLNALGYQLSMVEEEEGNEEAGIASELSRNGCNLVQGIHQHIK